MYDEGDKKPTAVQFHNNCCKIDLIYKYFVLSAQISFIFVNIS